MAKDPAFLFYSSDFLSGVADLTMEERGQYITLLCLQHQKGRLSEKIIKLNQASPDVLQKFLRDENGNFYNPRLEEVVIKRKKHSDYQRENANKRWNKDAKSMPNECQTDTKTMPLENENENRIRDEIKDFGKFENLLVPRMSTLFTKHNPNYPANRNLDSQSLFSIAKFFSDQGKLRGSPETNVEEILQAWEPVCVAISKDNFYRQKSLRTIANHIQEILQTVLHGKSDSKTKQPISRSVLSKKFNERDYGGEQNGNQSGAKVA